MHPNPSRPAQAAGVLWQQLFRLFPYTSTSSSPIPTSGRIAAVGRLVQIGLRILRSAAKRSLKNPGFSAVTILVLAVGIGANTAVFLLLDAVLLRPLPYPDPQRLVHITARERTQSNLPGCLSYAHFASLSQPGAALSDMAGYVNESFALTGRGNAARLAAARVSSNFLDVLSVHPLLGRNFLPAENRDQSRVVIISERLWRQRFGSQPGVIGGSITLDSKPHTIVGVLPASFAFEPVGTKIDVWAPSLANLSLLTPQQVQAGACYLNAVGRLTPGSSLGQAQAGLAIRHHDFVRQNAGSADADPKRILEVVPLSEKLVGGYRPMFLTFAATVFLFLLIACANVAGLSLARAIERRKEVALRIALGATRLHIVTELIAESLLLALVGGLIGLALCLLGGSFARNLAGDLIPRLSELHTGLNWRVFGFSLAVSALTGLLCGLFPAMQFADSNLNGALRESGRGIVGSRWRNLSRNTLVVSQIVISVLLLVGAGHLEHSFLRLKNETLGFNSQGVLTMNVMLPDARYSKPDQITQFFSRALDQIDTLPGVHATAVSSALPVNESRLAHVLAEGQPALPIAQRRLVALQTLSPSYLRVLGIPLLKGRFFSQADKSNRARVAVLNQTFARIFFPGQDPIGKHVWLGKLPIAWEVVGVIGDIKNVSLASPAQAELDLPFGQLPWPQMNLVIRSELSNIASLSEAVQAQIARQDKDQPLTDIQTLDELLSNSRSQPRLVMTVLTVFAGLAFLIAAIGIYSVISYYAAQRMSEFGIRMALGAPRRNVALIVLRQAAQISGLGIGIGLVSAFALTRAASSVMYGIREFDAWPFVAAPALLFVIALVAALYPALRVTRLRPAAVLRAT